MLHLQLGLAPLGPIDRRKIGDVEQLKQEVESEEVKPEGWTSGNSEAVISVQSQAWEKQKV